MTAAAMRKQEFTVCAESLPALGILPFRAKGDALLQARSICPKLVGTVVARIGFQVCDCSSQIFDCSLNVTPTCSLTTRLKYCAVSTWVSAMISLALLSRSLRFKEPGPEMGQMRSRTSARLDRK